MDEEIRANSSIKQKDNAVTLDISTELFDGITLEMLAFTNVGGR